MRLCVDPFIRFHVSWRQMNVCEIGTVHLMCASNSCSKATFHKVTRGNHTNLSVKVTVTCICNIKFIDNVILPEEIGIHTCRLLLNVSA